MHENPAHVDLFEMLRVINDRTGDPGAPQKQRIAELSDATSRCCSARDD